MAISSDGTLSICKRPDLEGRDAEALEILEKLYDRLPNASPDEVRALVNELSGPDRRKLYFAMHRACIAAERVFNLEKEPEYLEYNFSNPNFPLNIKQRAIVQFAFEERFITQGYPDFESKFAEGLKKIALPGEKEPSLWDRLKTRR